MSACTTTRNANNSSILLMGSLLLALSATQVIIFVNKDIILRLADIVTPYMNQHPLLGVLGGMILFGTMTLPLGMIQPIWMIGRPDIIRMPKEVCWLTTSIICFICLFEGSYILAHALV